MPKLTETWARKRAFSATGTEKHWDTEVKGFVLYVGKRSKTWYFQKDVGGQTRRQLIGRYPVISAAAAREAAQQLALDWSRGVGKAIQTGAPTLEAALKDYVSRPKLRSDKYRKETLDQVRQHLRDWLRLPLPEITRAMVVARHRGMSVVPSAANHTLRRFRAIWNHARRTHDLPECPTLAVEWYPDAPDGRIIDDLPDWRAQVAALDNPIHAAFYRLLLFTGLRRTEAITLRWENVLEDRIHLPMTKNGRSFDLPITDAHLEILAPLRRLSRIWVFPSPNAASGHIETPARLAWSPHAHRRTFATVGVEAGLLEEVVGRLLNHTPLSVTGRRYARPSLDALRPAMQTTCDALHARIRGDGHER